MESSTYVCRLEGDQESSCRIADVLSETFGNGTAVTAFANDAGGWSVEAHFMQRPDEDAIRLMLRVVAGDEAARAAVFETVPMRDWVKASLDALTPVQAGRFVVHGSHDRAKIPPNTIAIEIEAALAFGTGHHGTTRGCLLALDALAKRTRSRRVLDLGTGTGILAIAAAKTLRTRVIASDIDIQAVEVAKENAKLNRVAHEIAFVHAPGVGARSVRVGAPYDLVFANILLQPLKRMASDLARLTSPNGRIVLSGLLARHASGALSAYRARGLALERRITLEGWVTLVMKRGR